MSNKRPIIQNWYISSGSYTSFNVRFVQNDGPRFTTFLRVRFFTRPLTNDVSAQNFGRNVHWTKCNGSWNCHISVLKRVFGSCVSGIFLNVLLIFIFYTHQLKQRTFQRYIQAFKMIFIFSWLNYANVCDFYEMFSCFFFLHNFVTFLNRDFSRNFENVQLRISKNLLNLSVSREKKTFRKFGNLSTAAKAVNVPHRMKCLGSMYIFGPYFLSFFANFKNFNLQFFLKSKYTVNGKLSS